jgi:molecular chaperone GrpE
MSPTPPSTDESAAEPEATEAAPADETSDTRLSALEVDKRELHDRLLRLAAEFENWKKRARREQEEAGARGREQLLREILPALDNLERALKAAPEKDPVAVGVRLVDKALITALEKFDVKRFSALGQPFDPNQHEAIQQVESTDHAPGTVAAEFAVGYTIGGRLLRAAIVAVAKAPPGASPAPVEGAETNGAGDGGQG